MRAYRGQDRIAYARCGQRRTVGVRPVQHQPLDALGKRCGKSDGGATSRRAADERHTLDLELIEQRAQRCDLPVEAEIRILHLAVRHADAEPVVADKGVAVRDSLPESPKGCALPVKFEVAHPPRRSDERWTVPTHLVCDAAGAKGKE